MEENTRTLHSRHRRPERRLAVEGFGELFVDQIRTSHVEVWKEQVGPLIGERIYAPTTVNGWLSILRVVMKTAALDFELPRVATEGVRDFDESNHVTYTEEAPNALTTEQVPAPVVQTP